MKRRLAIAARTHRAPVAAAALALALMAAGLICLCASASAQAAGATRATPPARWVAVSIATLWVKPGQTRSIDRPALQNPADPRAWVAGMSVSQKLWLNGRLETQALYGTKVLLLGSSGDWSKVAITGQPTPRNKWGYPGWLPTRQITSVAPVGAGRVAVVRRLTTWLWSKADLTGRVLELSYDTRLPVVRSTATCVEVVTMSGRHRFVQRSAVSLHVTGVAWPRPTAAQVVAEAKRFLGLQYLYGGSSGFGFDCSGFTHSVYDALGVTIPRDADAQAAKGTKISSRSALRPGDLIFFQDSTGHIHHVGMYVGSGMMIHSPSTGSPVRLARISDEPYSSEFAGGRRYVGS